MASDTPAPKPALSIQPEEATRKPSPQPTHFSVPLVPIVQSNGHRVLRSATVGYVAPTFAGKFEQMKDGKVTRQARMCTPDCR